MGLAISYGVVKMHRGALTVRSNTDPAAGPTGSTFRVTLPLRAPEQLSDAAAMVGQAEMELDGEAL